MSIDKSTYRHKCTSIAGGSLSKNLISYNSHNLIYGNSEITQNLYIDGSLNIFGQDLQNKVLQIDSSLNSINSNIILIDNSLNSINLNLLTSNSNITTNTNIITNLQNKTTNLFYEPSNGYTFINGGSFAFYSNVVLNQDTIFQTNLNGISTLTFSYLSGLSSNIQNQLNSIINTVTNQFYSSGITTFSDNVNVSGNLQGLSTTIYGYLNSISSNVQNQINSINSNMTNINNTIINVQNQTINTVQYTTFLNSTNQQQNSFFGNDNTTISGCILKSPNPQYSIQTISNQISANAGNVLIGQI